MKDLNKIVTEIEKLTTTIETKYPELYRSLDENPITIPTKKHPQVDRESMREYLESLRQMLKHYKETHKKNN